ncbi:S-adenosyl-L-methionine-dependent methyltransferase [Lipomyces tetrasporus]|uniref:S-adenosyl-L-methionine-dependent methyltransferase n=1 Tax=Lipomyces tetrasporus TaxID=54092 RepID=A0AAD7QKL0_9ASCO|nr:S-adenosyl-L-methionine-dependent methyltransferase [Lipomyces tetrasporus]KAJ8096615.1 S-adenosyl-L-methionine-dependent methyltransferase [Lipomyces tetrasporus]
MAQNIYDNQEFFDGYSKLARSRIGLQGAPEWPNLQAMVQDVRDLRVMDLGCGFGWFCRWARQAGAARVHGIDISQNMLSKALTFGSDPAITYESADLDLITLPVESFDLVYSSLAFHYLVDLRRLFGHIYNTLTPQGRFVYSVEHPTNSSPSNPSWQRTEDGQLFWPLNNYSQEGPRITDWLTKGVRRYHRTLDTYLSLLLEAGFTLTSLKEWVPSDEYLRDHPDWAEERHRPVFLLVAAAEKVN